MKRQLSCQKKATFPSFSRNIVAAISSTLLLSKKRHSLGLGEKLRKAAANSAFSFPRSHLLSKSKSNLIVWPNLGKSCVIA